MAPEISVVVASHDRPLRLRWLLNALEEQTLERARWDLVVAHDSSGPETAALLAAHPVGARVLEFPPGPGPAIKRNAGWRAAAAPVVVFTDDDCRPPPEWLERLLEAVRAHPGAVVQGAVRVDPDEEPVKHAAPWSRSQEVTPPSPYGQTANIAYPRDVLERAGGFDEALPLAAGEDTDLLVRAQGLGAPYVAAPGAVTFHAVVPGSLADRVRDAWRWQHLAHVVRKHPQLREHLWLGAFWHREHALLLAAAAGAVVAARGRPAGALAALPWVATRLGEYGSGPRARARAAGELPGRALLDAAEIAAAVRGSLRYRTVFL